MWNDPQTAEDRNKARADVVRAALVDTPALAKALEERGVLASDVELGALASQMTQVRLPTIDDASEDPTARAMARENVSTRRASALRDLYATRRGALAATMGELAAKKKALEKRRVELLREGDRLSERDGADRLQDESKALCGVGVGGRYFAPTLKYVVPSVLIVMLAYNLTREGETYGGYPRYAIGIFGWLCCVVAPVTLIGLGVAKPFSLLRPGAYLDLEDEEERAGGGGGVAGEGSLEMGRVRSRD